MVEEVVFVIPGQPVGKGRPRFTKTGHAFTPSKTAQYEALIRRLWDKSYPPMEGAVAVKIIAGCQVPKGSSRKQRSLMLGGDIPHTKKPDVDNIAKIVMDGLNGLAYHDDAQVVELTVRREYMAVPAVIVRISKL